jgi:cyclic pyranopterin phosphate synthase
MDEFSHVEDDRVSMVDVGGKAVVDRRARAAGRLVVEPATAEAIRSNGVEKGNVLATARIAAIQAVKRTWADVPLCHQIPIDGVEVTFDVTDAAVCCEVTVESTGQTGVEMEALNGVTRALLTVFDMVKSAEKDDDGEYPTAEMTNVRVLEKHKGAGASA